MSKQYIFVKETTSTNVFMKELLRTTDLPEGFVVRTDFQTSGKGQGSNVWESAKGKNLLFSLLLQPTHIPIGEQFLIAQIMSLGIVNTLNKFVQNDKLRNPSDNDLSDSFTIKWPNDIYWGNKKIGGMLIENVWQGSHIKSSIVGVGLNVNQKIFYSDAPNPISLFQILGKKTSKKTLLHHIIDDVMNYYRNFQQEKIRKEYTQQMFRREGCFQFKNGTGFLKASICGVEKDGRLLLKDSSGIVSGYYFKEVEFVV